MARGALRGCHAVASQPRPGPFPPRRRAPRRASTTPPRAPGPQVLTGGLQQLSDNARPAFDLAWECFHSRPGCAAPPPPREPRRRCHATSAPHHPRRSSPPAPPPPSRSEEPAAPYFLLKPGDKHYKERGQQEQQQASGK
jgi:hypothetical protein